jgi:hypothetical protein
MTGYLKFWIASFLAMTGRGWAMTGEGAGYDAEGRAITGVNLY